MADKNKMIPAHVAIIMDGNGRWAKKRGLPRVAGHRSGVKTVREIVEAAGEAGVQVLTLYTFSTENWQRPFEEVSALMKLLIVTLRQEINDLMSNNVRLRAIGDLDKLPEDAKQAFDEGIQTTANNTGLTLNLALNYGSREEIIKAVKQIGFLIRDGNLDPDGITGQTIQAHLYTSDLPDPDLLIRTSGEMRLSNFLLWQLAYTELFVTDILWPDFKKKHFFQALESYQKRERRFGKVSEQIKK